MRTRDLKPDFFRNDDLTKLPAYARLLYQGLWLRADKKGRQKDIAELIKSDIFPYEKVPVERLLGLLADAGFITRYEVDGRRYLWVRTFRKHQHPHPKEPDSVIPPAPDDTGPDNVEAVAEPLPVHGGAVASQPIPSIPSNTLTTSTPTTNPDAPPGGDAVVPVVRAFERSFGRLLSPTEIESIRHLDGEHPRERIDYALREASDLNKRSVRYVQSICENQAKNGDNHDRRGNNPKAVGAAAESTPQVGGFAPRELVLDP